MKICLLTTGEVARLRKYDIQPNPCSQHRHITSQRAVIRFTHGLLEIIDGEDGKQYAYEPPLHVLKRVGPSIQRVRGIPYKHITPPPMLELD